MNTTTCKCGAEARPGQRTCRACHAAYMVEHRRRAGDRLDEARALVKKWRKRAEYLQRCQELWRRSDNEDMVYLECADELERALGG